MRHRAFAPSMLVLLALAGGAAAAETSAEKPEISPAEQMVFLDDHLGGVRPPMVLRYSMAETGAPPPKTEEGKPAPPAPAAPGPADQLKLELKASADGGCCAVAAEEVGGQAFGFLPAIDDAKSNPVILYFLERDIRQMQAATGGQSAYFRRRIRLALADRATVRDVTVRYGGKELPAREVRVTPYADDPRRALFEALADRSYSFLLATGVPGGVYQIRTVTPAAVTGATAAETVLTLAEASVAAAQGRPVQERPQ